jgi:hypothetical protein
VTTVHVVPVGISLLGRIDRGELADLRYARPAPAQTDASPDGPVRHQLRLATGADGLLAVDRLLDGRERQQLRPPTSHELSAEWSTVRAARDTQPAGEDAVVLLATDTDDGLRSALLVAARYTDQIRYLDDPLGWRHPPRVEEGGVYLCRAPGLDLARPDLGTDVWRALGRIGHLVADDARRTPRQVIFHLSGGYKAVIPYLMVLAETVRSVLCDPELTVPGTASTVRAVALHESSAGLVDIPVRTWPPGSWSLIRKLADWIADRAAPPQVAVPEEYSELAGLLLDWDGRSRRLNRYGWIMVNVP